MSGKKTSTEFSDILMILVGFILIIAVFALFLNNNVWDEYKTEHNCKLISEAKTVIVARKVAIYECDNGVLYVK